MGEGDGRDRACYLMGSESQHDGWAECVFSMCRLILNGSTMDVGAMQECDAMDGGAGGDANLFAALMQIRLSEPVGMKKK